MIFSHIQPTQGSSLKSAWDGLKLSILILVTSLFASCSEHAGFAVEQELNANWEFRQVGSKEWRGANVPGTVHQDLMAHDLIPDPYDGANEKEVQWVENEDWEYRCSFELDKEMLQRDAVMMEFEGLDTYADVYLNDTLLFSGDNMFVGYEKRVERLLKRGSNELKVYFHSPINFVMPDYEATGFEYPADNDAHEKHLSVYSRKAPYHYGWDWGIRLVTSGIWRPIRLKAYDLARIDDLHIVQTGLNEEQAHLQADLNIDALRAGKVNVNIVYGNETVSKELQLTQGENTVSLPFTINNPELWWPNGWGEAHLYEVEVEVEENDVVLASSSKRVGLRTVEVINEPDEMGESFYFKVNGIPMFAKGANYIPGDNLLPRVSEEKYRKVFEDAVSANMNMIRVWGGGIYENEIFYDLADENGILVWQDFMFACTVYPSDAKFMKRVEEEAEYNIKRLRNHPSIAIWCGNNEVQVGWDNWGWQDSYGYSKEVQKQLKDGYDSLFKGLLPKMVQKYDSDKFYFHSSPISNWGNIEDFSIGDNHYWGVWWGKHPFEEMNRYVPRFMSEFGYQAFPEMKTIRSFADEADFDIESEVMKVHQKSSIGNVTIKEYMENYYRMPDKFEDFVYLGLIMQAEGMQVGFEAHRRNMPYCMGTLYWQFNDCWPVVSWSGIDYYGNWKALHYKVRDAFEPIIVSPILEDDMLNVYVVSDELKDREVSFSARLTDFNGKEYWSHKQDYTVGANSSKVAFAIAEKALLAKGKRSDLVLHVELHDGEDLVAEKNHYFNPVKKLNLPEEEAEIEISELPEGVLLSISTDKLLKNLYLELPQMGVKYSDNFFDMMPGSTKEVILNGVSLEQVKSQLQVKSVRDTY